MPAMNPTVGEGVKAVMQTLSKPAESYTVMNVYGAPARVVPRSKKVAYDPIKDFIPLGGPLQAVDVIVIRKD